MLSKFYLDKVGCSTKSLVLFGILFCFFFAGCSHRPARKAINTKSFSLDFYEYKKSESGDFLLGLVDIGLVKKRPMSSELLALSSAGEISFQRTFVDPSDRFFVSDFKMIEPHIFSYFLCKPKDWHSPGQIFFLDPQWSDVVQNKAQNLDAELDCHDVVKSPKGNYIYLFYRKKSADIYVNPELREINDKGENVFSWKLLEHVSLPPNVQKNDIDPIHLNSIFFMDEHTMLISLSNTDEIILVDYPSGKVKATISKVDWKFLNDSLGGFEKQHSVQYLGKNRILMFDNGDNDHIKNARKSRAVEYELDFKNKTLNLVWEFRADFVNGLRDFGGSAQRLSNGNTVIGWGAVEQKNYIPTEDNPIFTEVSPKGEKIRELKSKNNLISYRVFFNSK